jgi:hypothetical protein
MKRFFLILITIGFALGAKADTVTIRHFLIKENPFSQNEIAVVATDTAGVTQESVTGDFSFTINGFQEQLKFEHGIAFYRHKLLRSSFMFLKHENELGSVAMLYYVYKGDKLMPIHISWLVLVVIPLALVLLGYLFKKFLVIALVLFCIFFYFNYHNGLSVPTFFESIIDGLKHVFH